MTNRLVLDDAQLGVLPADSRQWSGFQRQLAKATAPGYESRVLLADQTTSSATFAALTDLTVSLDASTRYYFEWFGGYNREDTNDVTVRLQYSGTTPGHPENLGWAGYHLAGTGDVVVHRLDPLSGTGLAMTSGVGLGYSFHIHGWITTTTAGDLTAEWAQNVASGVAATMYSGTRLIVQPIINIADKSNP